MNAPLILSTPVDSGARYACEQVMRELDGATSLLSSLAREMDSSNDGVERENWASSLRFISRALANLETFALEWVKADDEKGPAEPVPDELLVGMEREAIELWARRQGPAAEWWELCRSKKPRDSDDMNGEADRVGALLEPIDDRLWDMQRAAISMPATTFSGARAKATLAVFAGLRECTSVDGLNLRGLEWHAHLMFEVCRDLVRLSGIEEGAA